MNRRSFMQSLSGALAGLALFRFVGAQGMIAPSVPAPDAWVARGFNAWGEVVIERLRVYSGGGCGNAYLPTGDMGAAPAHNVQIVPNGLFPSGQRLVVVDW